MSSFMGREERSLYRGVAVGRGGGVEDEVKGSVKEARQG